jgi:hypothetical protein
MPDTPQWIPQTDAEMKAYLDSALPLEDACLLTLLASDEPVTASTNSTCHRRMLSGSL